MPTKFKCSTPGCDCTGPLVLHSKCHPGMATWTKIHGDVLTVICSECEKLIAMFKIASEEA